MEKHVLPTFFGLADKLKSSPGPLVKTPGLESGGEVDQHDVPGGQPGRHCCF